MLHLVCIFGAIIFLVSCVVRRNWYHLNYCVWLIGIGILSFISKEVVTLATLDELPSTALVGDIYASPRRVAANDVSLLGLKFPLSYLQIPYYHVITVTDLKEGNISRITHFDPNETFDQAATESLWFKLRLIFGIDSEVVNVVDDDKISLLVQGAKLLERGTTSHPDIKLIKSRVKYLEGKNITYGIIRANCESIARYLRSGSFRYFRQIFAGKQGVIAQGILIVAIIIPGLFRLLAWVLSDKPFRIVVWDVLWIILFVVVWAYLSFPNFSHTFPHDPEIKCSAPTFISASAVCTFLAVGVTIFTVYFCYYGI